LTDARARSGSALFRRRNPRLIGAAVALATLVVAGGAVWRYADHRNTIHVSASDPATSVTARMELPKTIVGGTQVEAALVIDNNTGADITIPGCGPMWYVALTDASHGPDIGFAEPCLAPLVIRVGQTRYPTMVVTSYRRCVEAPSIGSIAPTCVNGSAPPLPAGEYTAILVGNHKDPLPGIPNPAPVNVRVVAPGNTPTPSTTAPIPDNVITRIEVPHTIVAGEEFEAVLVIDNNSGRELGILNDGCQPKWSIVLTNETNPAVHAFTWACQLSPLIAQIGQTRFAIKNRASLSVCSQDDVGDASIPKCLADGSQPPLLPGEYRAILVGALPGIPNPTPVTVQVVASSS
jgi:hypothetical protein